MFNAYVITSDGERIKTGSFSSIKRLLDIYSRFTDRDWDFKQYKERYIYSDDGKFVGIYDHKLKWSTHYPSFKISLNLYEI